MSQIIDRIKQSNIALIFTAVILFLFVSFSSHFTNLFFLPAEKRYLVIIGFLIADAIIFFLVWRFSNKRGFQKKIAELNLPLLLFPITLVAALVIAASGFIPSFRVPVDHRLEISFLPSEKGDSNKIDIHKIIRTINAPQEGGAEVEYDQLAIQGGFYEFTGDGIRLEENATLSFSSFYSGCVSILFNTSPDSGQVLVRFDKTEEKFSLNSRERAPTTVNLCSALPLKNLPFKWQIITLLLYVSDFFSILVVAGTFVLLNYFLWGNKDVRVQKTVQKWLIFISAGLIIMAALFQIYRIIFNPNETLTNAPPAKPVSVPGPLTFSSIYQHTLHTKKFAHTFIFMFLDVYQKLDAVYIREDTLKEFGFRSDIFNRWFSVYQPQPASRMPVAFDPEEEERLINTLQWSTKQMLMEERDIMVVLNYLTTPARKYVLISNRGFQFYLFPDTTIENSLREK